MASTYSYTSQFNLIDQTLLPPMYRQPNHIAWLNALSSPLQYLQDEIFSSSGYINGSLAPTYDPTITYTPSNQVIYTNRGVYINTATSSGVNPPTTGPTNSNWELYNSNYIGVYERSRYNAQVLLYEYALNRWFQTNITTPPFSSGGIFITPLNASFGNTWILGQASQYSSAMMATMKTPQRAYLGNRPNFAALNYDCYTINVNNTWATANIGNTFSAPLISSASESIIRDFADTLNIAGMLYTVQTY